MLQYFGKIFFSPLMNNAKRKLTGNISVSFGTPYTATEIGNFNFLKEIKRRNCKKYFLTSMGLNRLLSLLK